MISIGPTQEAVRRQVKYFENRHDYYNAREAVKGIKDESEYELILFTLQHNEMAYNER
jgi:hypothetical protein